MIKLSKEVCKWCRKHHPGQKLNWTKYDEEHWENGDVWCNVVRGNIIREGGAHADCPYNLEHIVMGK